MLQRELDMPCAWNVDATWCVALRQWPAHGRQAQAPPSEFDSSDVFHAYKPTGALPLGMPGKAPASAPGELQAGPPS